MSGYSMTAPHTPPRQLTGISLYDNHNTHQPSEEHTLLFKPEELDALAPGRRVVDATSDLWTKHTSGAWEHYGEFVPSTSLATAWGPLRLLPEEGTL